MTLFKIIKNHFLDKEFLLGDEAIINSNIVKEVLEKDEGEIKMCYKHKTQMLNVKSNERQKFAPVKLYS